MLVFELLKEEVLILKIEIFRFGNLKIVNSYNSSLKNYNSECLSFGYV
ncbi:hypothetical protein MKD41_06145 [Lutibacter sp. A64]|nr:hypothetical protein [Lutibacter sp. A64]UMB55052.1 hypothetical protein MKD41_06145 [Lutibacter sp. A64]